MPAVMATGGQQCHTEQHRHQCQRAKRRVVMQGAPQGHGDQHQRYVQPVAVQHRRQMHDAAGAQAGQHQDGEKLMFERHARHQQQYADAPGQPGQGHQRAELLLGLRHRQATGAGQIARALLHAQQAQGAEPEIPAAEHAVIAIGPPQAQQQGREREVTDESELRLLVHIAQAQFTQRGLRGVAGHVFKGLRWMGGGGRKHSREVRQAAPRRKVRVRGHGDEACATPRRGGLMTAARRMGRGTIKRRGRRTCQARAAVMSPLPAVQARKRR